MPKEYCLSREELDFVMSVTHFKSKAEWSEDLMKGVETKVKSAFTRTFNQTGSRARCNIAVDEFKRKRGRGKGAAAPSDDLEPYHQQKSWISRTSPADYMRYLISINTGFLAIPFNGGMFGQSLLNSVLAILIA
ncbi:hypothetical protein WJX75_002807 [Coccomyxa subellipsoidea]|uniref:DNA replication factor RFC1 C-terminal domain-containing protein n=1 Tax=Coccomyxa subellipsoidea TaxID=248742 RepID=A0ABR2YTJ6_9CHLO